MKYLLVFTVFLFPLKALSNDPTADVMEVINSLFEGMRRGDSTMVRGVFTGNARLITVFEKEGKQVLRVGSIDRFVNAVGSPHDKVWNEPIWDTEVKIDGGLAQVWTKYAFYLGEEFSHCGVDAFQLFKSDKGWKIFQLTDTRRYQKCEFPPYK